MRKVISFVISFIVIFAIAAPAMAKITCRAEAQTSAGGFLTHYESGEGAKIRCANWCTRVGAVSCNISCKNSEVASTPLSSGIVVFLVVVAIAVAVFGGPPGWAVAVIIIVMIL